MKRRLGREDLAFAVALCWALFPSHGEVLAQTAFKKHQLVLLFALLMLETPYKLPFFALSLLCRESGLMLLPLLWLDSPKEKALKPMAALAAVYALLHAWLLPRALTGPMGGGLLSHLLTSSKILGWHLFELAFPIFQSQEYSLAIASPSSPSSWLIPSSLAGLAWWLWPRLKKDRESVFAAAWTLLFLAPFTNILPYLNYSLVANRYHYAASAGFLLLLARTADRLKVPSRAVVGTMAGLVIFYLSVGLPHASLYAEPVELWEQAVKTAPYNPRARLGYGAALREAGRDEEAVAQLRRGPRVPQTALELSQALHSLGRDESALKAAELRASMRADAQGLANLGLMRLAAGKKKDAVEPLARAYAMDPAPEIALLLGQTGEPDALSWLEAAAVAPSLRPLAARAKGAVLEAKGRKADAAAAYADAYRLDPFDFDSGIAAARLSKDKAALDALLARLASAPASVAERLAPVKARAEKVRASLKK